MADDKPPSRAPWLDDVKRSRQLSLRFDDSLGKTGWDQVFKNAITEFNKLSAMAGSASLSFRSRMPTRPMSAPGSDKVRNLWS